MPLGGPDCFKAVSVSKFRPVEKEPIFVDWITAFVACEVEQAKTDFLRHSETFHHVRTSPPFWKASRAEFLPFLEATNWAILSIDRKLSISSSSSDTVTPNSSSRWRSSSTKAIESSPPVSNR